MRRRLVIAIVLVSVFVYSWAATRKTVAPEKTLPLDTGRVNILLLGTGGTRHDGPDLTDTIIVAAASPSGTITLISIPRDIYLDSLQGKINMAYAAGGLARAEQEVSLVTGLPIHYAVRFDFTVFERIIDILGGIDVNVTSAFDDYLYPIDGRENDNCGLPPAVVFDDESAAKAFPCRYEHLHFDAGVQHMDGKTALKFVRSRHAAWPEGSDFARSQRQQLVIKATKNKILSEKDLLNLPRNLAIFNELKTNIDTDMDFSSPRKLLDLALRYSNAQFKSISLGEAVLVNPPEDERGWILLPATGTWDQIHQLIATESGQVPQ